MLAAGVTVNFSPIASISSHIFIQKINKLALLFLPVLLLGFTVGWRVVNFKARNSRKKITSNNKAINKILRLEI